MNSGKNVLRLMMSAGTVALLALMAQTANADDKRHAKLSRKIPVANFCLNSDSNPACDAAFAAALLSMSTGPDVTVTAAHAGGPHGLQPLSFQKRAPWVRRLETLGKEGIPFTRVKQSPDSELVLGINRKGVLGFELKQIASR